MKMRPENTTEPVGHDEALIDLDQIDFGRNIRTNIEQLTEANDELVKSILAKGVLQPIGVFPSGERFTLIFGQRRTYCSRLAGMKSIRAKIFPPPVDDAELLILATQENSHRVDADPVEFAEALRLIKQARNWTSDEVARSVCLTAVKVCRLLKLADLSEELKRWVKEGRLGITPALELGKFPVEEQLTLIPLIAEGKATRERLVGIRKTHQRSGRAGKAGHGRQSVSRATAALASQQSVTVAGSDLDMETFIGALEQCLQAARKSRSSGMTLATFLRMLRDQQEGAHV